MNVLGAGILVVLMGVVLSAPRKVALVGMMAGVLYLTQAQQIEVLGFNLYATRFLELAGFIRVMACREFSFRQLNRIDRVVLWLYGFTTVVFLFRSSEAQAYQVGTALDAFLTYFTFRGLLAEVEDFAWFLRAFVFLLIPYTLVVMFESLTDHNLFALLGGVEGGSYWMRNGRPRCFGSFRQPDTLGMFGACFLPLYIALACIRTQRKHAFTGIGLCLILVWAANAGGAASGAIVGLVGWGAWRLRTQMRKVRWAITIMIVLLALVMKAPIWYIFAHMSSITGGDGWHRSYLIDVAYQHFGQWWFAGLPISKTSGWFPYDLSTTGGADITNQYLDFGFTAGLGAIALFIVLLTRSFSSLGKALAVVRSSSARTSQLEFMLWGLGVMLIVHIVNWFGIVYFDQMYVVWFMELATVSSISDHCLKERQKTDQREDAVGTPMDIGDPQSGLFVENLK